MPTIDEKVRDVLGAQMLEIIRLQHRVETLEADAAKTGAPQPKPADNGTGTQP